MTTGDNNTQYNAHRQEDVPWFYRDFNAADLLNHIFTGVRRGTFAEITYIAPGGVEAGPSPITESYEIGRQKLDWAHIQEMNERGYGVYYGLCAKRQRCQPGRRSHERDAAMCGVLWVDVDLQDGHYADKDAICEALNSLRPVPTAFVDSGGGIHGLWRIAPVEVTESTLPRIKQTLRGLALAARSDTKVAELARVFRLPDTVNTKPSRNGARCEVLDMFPWNYTLDHFNEYYALAQPAHISAPVHIQVPDGVTLTLPRWVSDYLEHGAPGGSRNARLFAAAIEFRVNGYSIAEAEHHLINRYIADGNGSESVEERETEARATIASAWRSAHGSANVPSHIALRKAAQERRAGGAS